MMKKEFQINKPYEPQGDQIRAIEELTRNYKNGIDKQVLLGATGTGKTFTFANIIQNLQKKTLVMVHNKTLAAQLYMELKELFPNNRVEYFVSYFDYYQPEAYIPRSDTYIEKSSQVNDEIEMLRLSTITSLASSDDVIVVASVAAIYASISKANFEKYAVKISVGQEVSIKHLRQALVKLNYERNDISLTPGTFRSKGDVLDIALGYTDEYFLRISFFGDEIEDIYLANALEGKKIKSLKEFIITSATEYVADSDRLGPIVDEILEELAERVKWFNRENKLLEAQRIDQRTRYDIEAIQEFGYCSGVENYSRFFDNRLPGSTPYTIFDFFNENGNDWLLIIDESHITLPQIRGMYNTDRSRKESLVEYGFRLPSALDNRPLKYEEFLSKISKALFVSATPNEWEIDYANNTIVEQIVRPTGLLDPKIEVRPTKNQMEDLLNELKIQKDRNEKTFITVMTIRMAEELTHFLQERGVKTAYLHNELKTLERSKIINNMRRGLYDVVVGINLLREGLDVPEVSLVAIFDADKPGFFRSDKSLIQIIGRAARNANGRVIMYGDEVTTAMDIAITETNRRRSIQEQYNKEHNIVPKTVIKAIREDVKGFSATDIKPTNVKSVDDKKVLIKDLKKKMLDAANDRNYELAAEYRDAILELEAEIDGDKINKKRFK
ncbi:excinuclease ABC subunit UvrB [Ureaplasma ceti]|uniref:UvrABC system protein B n=1 Tax=Ureaplasma ceti TaxID=3119530 RepID=A0ABP9UCG5_9BACT